MKDMLDEINSKLNIAEERLFNLKKYLWNAEKTKNIWNEDYQWTMGQLHMHIQSFWRKGGAEKNIWGNDAKAFPNLMKTINLQIWKVQ